MALACQHQPKSVISGLVLGWGKSRHKKLVLMWGKGVDQPELRENTLGVEPWTWKAPPARPPKCGQRAGVVIITGKEVSDT